MKINFISEKGCLGRLALALAVMGCMSAAGCEWQNDMYKNFVATGDLEICPFDEVEDGTDEAGKPIMKRVKPQVREDGSQNSDKPKKLHHIETNKGTCEDGGGDACKGIDWKTAFEEGICPSGFICNTKKDGEETIYYCGDCPEGSIKCEIECISKATGHINGCSGKSLDCRSGFADCDNDYTNGCEYDLKANNASDCKDEKVTCINDPKNNNVYDSCGAVYKEGCRFNLMNNPERCGNCEKDCTKTKTTKRCVSGNCTDSCPEGTGDCAGYCLSFSSTNILKCSAEKMECQNGYANCDGKVDNGCEIDKVRLHVHECSNSMVVSCEQGYLDCDGSIGNGCEVNLMNDPLNCGGCGKDCTKNKTDKMCVSGDCGSSCPPGTQSCADILCLDYEANHVDKCDSYIDGDNVVKAKVICKEGFADCDGAANNGCEYNLIANNASECEGGNLKCKAGYSNCGGHYTSGCRYDLMTDPYNCGKCGNNCTEKPTDKLCVRGQCASSCPYGTEACAGICLDFGALHIKNCNGGEIDCLAGYKNCDGDVANGCEVNLKTDSKHCGSCNNDCGTDPTKKLCVDGKCKENCQDEAKVCFGYCVAFESNHIEKCDDPNEVISCKGEYLNCDGNILNGCESDTKTNSKHCGACGEECEEGWVCVGGNCVLNACSGSQTLCVIPEEGGGSKRKCINVEASDENHCGACNYKCSEHSLLNATSNHCKNGKCQYVCSNGFVNIAEDKATADTINCVDPASNEHCGAKDRGTKGDNCSAKGMICKKINNEFSCGCVEGKALCFDGDHEECYNDATVKNHHRDVNNKCYCENGYKGSKYEMSSCTKCEDNEISKDNNTSCEACTGNKVPDANQTECVKCPANQVPNKEHTACEKCPKASKPSNDGAKCVCDKEFTECGSSPLKCLKLEGGWTDAEKGLCNVKCGSCKSGETCKKDGASFTCESAG